MGLSTIYLYKLDFPSDANTDPVIQRAIDIATSYISSYCDRLFEAATYSEYHDGYGEGRLYLKQYPITAVSNLAWNITNVISITPTASNVYSVTYTADATDIDVTVNYSNSSSYTSTFDYATYYTMDLLNTGINSLANVSSEVVSTFVDDPSYLLRPINGLIRDGSIEWLDYYRQDNYFSWNIDPETDNVLEVSACFPKGIKNVYVRYTAGYTYPVDNAGHTALTTAGNVPLDLTNACNRLVAIILRDMTAGIVSGQYQSENLGDYSYALWNYGGVPKSSVEAFMATYENVLDKYKRKTLTW